MVRRLFMISAFLFVLVATLWSFVIGQMSFWFVVIIPYCLLGTYDMLSSHNILRNFPIIGHLRYFFEFIRPEIQQYFINTNQSGKPFSREQRSIVYQRAKDVIDTLPFGTQQDISSTGYELANHSISPKKVSPEHARVTIGHEQCSKPYSASRLNISAMSFGALSDRAIETLNWGAQMGNFAHNTGEGGLSQYHLKHKGDIILQIGTGNFGVRNPDGTFCDEKFISQANLDVVKMIEIKISQGAKPSHGGLLPGAKVDEEIAEIRGVEVGKDCDSPATHPSFNTPLEMMDFIAKLRKLSNGKPIGFKLAIGYKREFFSILKAMLERDVYPDFITVDGAEGGTGAAPLEFSNRLGLPINEALSFVHNALIGVGLRKKIKIIASGKIINGFDIVQKCAIGADLVNSARGMLFSVGCIQSLKCNTNHCPTGVATQDQSRIQAIVVDEKRKHVYNFHENTIKSFLSLVGAMGLDNPDDLKPSHILHRIGEGQTVSYEELYPCIEEGGLLKRKVPEQYLNDWNAANVDSF